MTSVATEIAVEGIRSAKVSLVLLQKYTQWGVRKLPRVRGVVCGLVYGGYRVPP
jgi:hypothetical protein